MECVPVQTFLEWLMYHPVASAPLAHGHVFVLESLQTGHITTWQYEPLIDAFCKMLDHKA